MKKTALSLLMILSLLAFVWVAGLAGAEGEKPSPSPGASHLLDRGVAKASTGPDKGGTPPPTGPTPIFYPGGSPAAVPMPPGFGAFGVSIFLTGGGGFLGNFFVPGVPGYPPSFLSAGGVTGFDLTGVYAWHLAPTTMASVVRVLGAAVVPPPSPVSAPAGPIPAGGFASATIPPTGVPAPSGLLSAPGLFTLRVTPGVSGIFCGLGVGGPGFGPIGAGPAGNGLGGVMSGVQPPLRAGPFPLAAGGFLSTVPASPAFYIAGCFADSSTTPVELMAFEVE
ncbi:MAG: hypothetical protein V3T72_20575 [Thermoanaerobaculia bacterium]